MSDPSDPAHGTGRRGARAAVCRAARSQARRFRDLALDAAGGPGRAKVVLVLAALLGLDGADAGTISSTASNLEHAFHIGNTQIGILTSVAALVGVLFTLPAGVLTDRTRRTGILAVAVLLWAGGMLASAAAGSYLWLLLAQVGLGAALAVAGPAVASLVGDYFPASERSRMYGLILGGELVGTGIGFVVSGDISTFGWRYAFLGLAPPTLALAWLVWRLPEPARGGADQLAARAGRLGERDADDGSAAPANEGSAPAGAAAATAAPTAATAAIAAGARPQPDLVLHDDPANRSLWWAVRYVLRVRTNVVIIVASALGYFYFDGLRSFAVIYATGHYRISKPTATALVVVLGAGALAGVYVGGRVADRMLRRGRLRARVLVPLVCLLAITPVLAPAIATTSVAIALPLLIGGAFLLGAPNPAMDAARLDIIHPKLWGRAEAVRTVLRTFGEATAPALFGYVSQYAFGGGSSGAAGTAGLEYTFLLFLGVLIAAALLVLPALRTYPRDVATAGASVGELGHLGAAAGTAPPFGPTAGRPAT